jgi:hypothetical protein
VTAPSRTGRDRSFMLWASVSLSLPIQPSRVAVW